MEISSHFISAKKVAGWTGRRSFGKQEGRVDTPPPNRCYFMEVDKGEGGTAARKRLRAGTDPSPFPQGGQGVPSGLRKLASLPQISIQGELGKILLKGWLAPSPDGRTTASWSPAPAPLAKSPA